MTAMLRTFSAISTPEPDAPSLADRLRAATASAHREVERGSFVQDLLRGRVARVDYVRMLAALLAIYTALEEGLEGRRGEPWLAWIDLPALRRVPALTRDLHHHAERLGAARPPTCAAALAYAGRLAALAEAAPALLVAHAYTRYLGDLSGGQALRRALARSSELSEETGLEFYAFTGDVEALRRGFREGLASLPAHDEAAAAIVDEARLAFELHAAMFDELAAPR